MPKHVPGLQRQSSFLQIPQILNGRRLPLLGGKKSNENELKQKSAEGGGGQTPLTLSLSPVWPFPARRFRCSRCQTAQSRRF